MGCEVALTGHEMPSEPKTHPPQIEGPVELAREMLRTVQGIDRSALLLLQSAAACDRAATVRQLTVLEHEIRAVGELASILMHRLDDHSK